MYELQRRYRASEAVTNVTSNLVPVNYPNYPMCKTYR